MNARLQTGPHPLPQVEGQMFVTDGGIETHMIFNEGEEVPHFCAFVMTDREPSRGKLKQYYRDYLPIARHAGQGFIFDTNTWRANPDWGTLVGYDADGLRRVNMAAVELCRDVQQEFAAAGVPTLISGAIGPRRDGWKFDSAMTVA